MNEEKHKFNVPADTIFVFPNNSNVILAAKQAAQLYSKADVRIINSKTIGDGYAALTMTDGELTDPDEVEALFNMGMENVITAEVSQCVRDADMQDVLDQAVRYNMVLNVKYIIITNGTKTFICRRGDTGYKFIDTVPDYEQMLG